MSGIGIGLALLGGGAIWLGISVPMSGAVMLGGALILGGIGTFLFGRAMSQRTKNGAYVDAMLTAYRRTLQKTMDQARSMSEVVEQPEIAMLADTPDKAVVWGVALGLHDEVAALLARGLEEQRAATGSPAGAYYPVMAGRHARLRVVGGIGRGHARRRQPTAPEASSPDRQCRTSAECSMRWGASARRRRRARRRAAVAAAGFPAAAAAAAAAASGSF